MTTFLVLIGIVLISYGIIGAVIAILKRSNPNQYQNLLSFPWKFIAIFIGGILIFFSSFIVKVGPQQVGVLVTPSGVSPEELKTGWHFKMPWNSVHLMNKTIFVYTFAAKASEGHKPDEDAIWVPTNDGFKMGYDVSVTWRIDPSYASWIYENITEDEGDRYEWLEENVVRPRMVSVMSKIVPEYPITDAYSTKIREIQTRADKELVKIVGEYHIVIDEVDIREPHYDPKFAQAIQNKKLAEQKVQEEEQITRQKEEQLKQAEINKKIEIEKAQGEAEALKIKGQSIVQNPKIIELEWIEAWEKGGAQVPKVISGDKGNMFMLEIK